MANIRLWSEADTAPIVRTLQAWWPLGARWNATTGKLLADHHQQVAMIDAAFELAVPTIMDQPQFWLEWTTIIIGTDSNNDWADAQRLYGYMLKLVKADGVCEHDEFAPSAQETFRADRASSASAANRRRKCPMLH